MQMIMLVLYDSERLDKALSAWAEVGVQEIGVVESESVQRCLPQRFAARYPFGFRRMARVEQQELILLGLLPDGLSLDTLVEALEKAIGSLAEEERGLLLAWEVGFVRGTFRCIIEGEA
ncbi:MAG: hypothetical protein H5T69_02950 [Chloroflexi bacterium]|nr:hypothetical protein [Chloroflexota bacterium]